MSRLSYFAKRLAKMDWRKMWKTAGIIRQRAGKSRLWLLSDMLRCGIRYNAGYMDYMIAEMYRLNDAQRATTITRGISNGIVRRMNDKKDWHFFDDKAQFDKTFAKWVRRGWMKFSSETTREELAAFLSDRPSVFVKPLEGSSGVGVARFDAKEYQDAGAFYERLQKMGDSIIEETVVQHEAMARLCPTSVNTVRIATLLGDRQEGIVYAFLRIGNGKVMDNVDCGGMACRVDLATGTLTTPAADKSGNVFEAHPRTGVVFRGFQVPFFEEAKAMCLEAMRVVPSVRFVAWDVAITPDGPVFIEGNSFPSHAVPQFAAHYPDGMGILTEFRKFIDC